MEQSQKDNRPHVVVLGAGFGGLNAARALGKLPVRVTVVDRKNHHTFQPLLYQVATAGLSEGDIAVPIRRILRKNENTEVFMGEAVGFDLDKKIVRFKHVEVAYDYLIVATGATHSYLAHPEWEKLAPGLKTVEDALEIRNRILTVFEEAERQQAVEGHHDELNFVVVGAGRVIVQPDCSLPQHPEVFVIGDLAALAGKDGHPLPGMAPVAIQMGRAVAANIARDLRGDQRKPFSYLDKGSMATIGRAAAVGVSGGVHFSGFIAWMAWLFIHLLYLVGFRNRLMVVMQWAWAYLRFEKAARLITGNVEEGGRAAPMV